MENREILFRGITASKPHKFVYGSLLQDYAGTCQIWEKYIDGGLHFIVIPETVGQFTGRTSVLLCEDNVIRRIRIYGGDRVETENGIGTVFYDEAETSYVVLYDDGNSEVLGLISGTLEIIGTIHDHLLEANNE